MNTRSSLGRALPLVCLLSFYSCAPSPTAPGDTINPGAEYKANVSSLYSSAGEGIEIKWKDSLGEIHALSEYKGTVVVVTFWRTNDIPSQQQIAATDSLATVMGDSVRAIGIAYVNVPLSHTFQVVSDYVQKHGIKIQIIADSLRLAQVQFAQSADNGLYMPETFIIKPSGDIADGGYLEGGGYSVADLQAWVRKAYK